MSHEPQQASAPLAVTMGDPAGIGPEIVLRALERYAPDDRPFVVGDPAWLAATASRLGLDLDVRVVAEGGLIPRGPKSIAVVPAAEVPRDLALGHVSAEAGAAAFACVRRGIELAMSGVARALVTAPINKAALAAAGIAFPGHTEMLAEATGADDVAMMLATPHLRVVLVSIHVPLAEAVRCIDHAGQLRAIRFADVGGRALGIERPRIAVAGLNPHAGEGGLFGREEIEIIAPAVVEARAAGLDVRGPLPGDSVFRQARDGEFDIVVAQYHDQGLIPIKYLGLADGVNVTLGLPFVRTSPDHGTAFDIVERGCADPASLVAAIALASTMTTKKSSTFIERRTMK